jgi:hypothetical protein
MRASFLTQLSSRIAGHLNQFAEEDPEKKGMAGKVVRGGLMTAGGVAIAGGLLGKRNLRMAKSGGRKLIGSTPPLPPLKKKWAPPARPSPTFGAQLAARIDAQLQEFSEIPLCEDGQSWDAPSLHVYGKKDPGLHKLPNSGKATISYRVRRKTVDIRDNGEERYGAEINVDSIEPVELSAILEKHSSHDFDRARDGGGRYSTGQDVSVGEMADAYLTPQRKKKAAVIAGAGAGLATAAVLGRKKISPKIGQAAARMMMR